MADTAGPAPLAAARRILAGASAADVAAAAYAAAFFAWLAFRTPGTPATIAAGSAAFYPLGLAVAWAGWSNARLPGLDARTRTAWYLLAASALALFAGGSAWDVYVQLTGPVAPPAWASGIERLHSLLFVSACLVFPGRKFEGRGRIGFLLDALVVVLAGSAVALYFGLLLWFRVLPAALRMDAVIGPVVNFAAFVAAAVGALQKRDRGTRIALMLLAVGVMAYAAAGYSFMVTTNTPGQPRYRPGDAIDGLWFLAWIFRWVAARVAGARYRHDGVGPGRGDESGPRERSGFSYLVVAAAFLLLLGRVYAGERQFLGVLAVSTSVMLGLLVTRQVVELDENDRLFRRQVEQQARFRSLVQHSSDIALIVGPDGTIRYASPAADRAFGEASPLRAGNRLPDVVREDDRDALGSVIASGRGPRRLLLHLPAGPDGWRDIEMLWNDRRGDASVGGFIFNGRDVTVRRELERRLHHAQKLDTVTRLADGLAHDVNNALTVIRGTADLLAADVEPGSPSREDLSHIRHAVDRAGDLTRKVLAFRRQVPVQPSVIDLNRVVEDLLPVLRQSVTSSVTVRLALASGLWPVRADQGQIEQVLVNLAANARDAMPDGGTFEIATANRVVDASSPGAGDLAPGEYVSLAATDDGVGIAADVLSRIFEPFFSTKPNGTGVGLAMVQGIVAGAGGRVFVRSAVGRGSSFTVLLPRAATAGADPAPPEREGERPAPSGTVLLVDDEASVRTVARRILERHGYRVIEAADGRQALSIIADPRTGFDVLLTDLVMPGVRGREVVERCAELRPSVPAVCMTGFAGDRDGPIGSGPRAAEILLKPFTAAALTRTLAAAIERRGAR